MKRLIIVAAAALTISSAGQAATASGAPFGCTAPAGQTCYFKIYYTPRRTRIVELQSGMRVTVPDVQVGTEHYCISVQKPPVNKCSQKLINATLNN
jgi:hypothetical protein